jgi:hypothetical protein
VQGTIAQIIALTTYGNAFLSGSPRFEPHAFFPANSTFSFCEHVRFVELKPKKDGREESAYASDPPEWFGRLKRDGVTGLRMVYGSSKGAMLGDKIISDRMLVGFVGGGGRWLIEAMKPEGSDFWEGRWEVGDREREDRKIWRVDYGRVAKNQPATDPPAMDAEALKSRFAATLEAIGNFARKQKMEGFAKAFEAGLAQLNSGNPGKGVYHDDLAPDRALPLYAAQLLEAAQASWVFGGMGSWNDVIFDGEDQVLYERLSEDLYQLLNAAIVTAANASAPSALNKKPKPWWKMWT